MKCGLIRGVVFSGSGLVREGLLYFESKCVSFILPASILDLMFTVLFHLDIIYI